MIFETQRLIVRKLTSMDFPGFHEMQSDDEVMRYTTGHGFDEAENLRQLNSCINAYSKTNNEFWVWAIARKSDQHFIGTCAIVPSENGPEIGYRFCRRFFGNGFGQEICNALIEHGKHGLQLKEIIACVDVRNVASVKILDRSSLPFVKELANETGGTDRFYRWSRIQ